MRPVPAEAVKNISGAMVDSYQLSVISSVFSTKKPFSRQLSVKEGFLGLIQST